MINLFVYLALYIYLFWFFFLGVMSILRAYKAGKMSLSAKILASPIMLAGVLIDLLFNTLPATLLFFDLPKEYMFTQRLIRYKKQTDDWRCKIANFICLTLLDPFDIGQGHCQ